MLKWKEVLCEKCLFLNRYFCKVNYCMLCNHKCEIPEMDDD